LGRDGETWANSDDQPMTNVVSEQSFLCPLKNKIFLV
jgi:hypothetical protein